MVRASSVGLASLLSLSLGGCIIPVAEQPTATNLATAAVEAPQEPSSARRPRARRTAAVPVPAVQARPAPNSSAAAWQMPWQLMPLGAAPEQDGETIVLSYVPQLGFVRGTSSTLASIGRPLATRDGPNRTVETCRQTVWSEASKSGATEVEAVSAGIEQRDRKGDFFAPVRMRVTYQRPSGWEVRESTLTCIVDRGGKIVDAYT